MKRKYFFFLLSCFLILAGILPLLNAEPSEQVIVTMLVASNSGDDMNLVNDAYRDKLIQLFSYTSYNQVGELSAKLERSKREKLDLPDGYELILTLQATENNRVMVQAVIRKENVTYVDTVLSILKPGTVFLGGPPSSQGVLILVLEAVNP